MPQGPDNRDNSMVSSFDDVSLMVPYQSIDDSSINGAFLDNENNYELQQGPKDLPLTGALSGDAISFLSSTLPYKKEGSSDTNFPHLSGSTPSSLEQTTDFESMGINREYVDGIVNNIPDNTRSNIATTNDTGEIPDFNADNPENLLSLENLTSQDVSTENVPEIAVPTPMINEQAIAPLQAAPLIPYTMQPDIALSLEIPENLANQPAQLDLSENIPTMNEQVVQSQVAPLIPDAMQPDIAPSLDIPENLANQSAQLDLSENIPTMDNTPAGAMAPETVATQPAITASLETPERVTSPAAPLEQGILPNVAPDIPEPEVAIDSNILATPEPQPPTVDMQPPLSEITRDAPILANIEPSIPTSETAPDIQSNFTAPISQASAEATIGDVIQPATQAPIASQPYVAPPPPVTNDVSMQEPLESNGMSNVEYVDNSFNNKVEQSNIFYDAQRPQLQESLNNFPMTSSDSKEINQTFNNLPESVENPTQNFSPDQIMTSSGNIVSETDAKEIKQLVVQNMVNDDIKGYVGEQLDKYIDGLTVDLLSQMTDLAQNTSEATLKKACEGI